MVFVDLVVAKWVNRTLSFKDDGVSLSSNYRSFRVDTKNARATDEGSRFTFFHSELTILNAEGA